MNDDPIQITSWGLASVLARGGKKPKTMAVAHQVPVMIEIGTPEEAPVVARLDGVPDHDRSVIRSLRGRLFAPVEWHGAPVYRGMFLMPTLQAAGGPFHIPKPKVMAGVLDDIRWREILDSGELEAIRLASTLVGQFVLIGDLLHHAADPPVWTVKVEQSGAVSSVQIAVGRFSPPKIGHALRFPLSDRDVAFAVAERIHRRFGSVQMVWPPRNSTAINVEHPEVFAGLADRMFGDDLRRELVGLGKNPVMAVLPVDLRRRWIALRRLVDHDCLDHDAVVRELTGLSQGTSASPGAVDESGFLGEVNGLLAVLACRMELDAGGAFDA